MRLNLPLNVPGSVPRQPKTTNPMQDSTPPIKLSNSTNVRMPLVLLIGLVGVCLAGALAWANVSGEVAKIPGIEAHLTANDAALSQLKVMANDIEWMRKYLEVEQRHRANANP